MNLNITDLVIVGQATCFALGFRDPRSNVILMFVCLSSDVNHIVLYSLFMETAIMMSEIVLCGSSSLFDITL